MRRIRHEVEIGAPAARVWTVLTEFGSYPDWNPFIRSISGEARAGSRLEVRIQPPGGRGMTFRPTVRAVQPGRELRWLGRLLVPGLFDGEHALRIEPLDEGRVRFVQEESFAGLLVPLLGGALRRTEEGFVQMNEALKRRVERGA